VLLWVGKRRAGRVTLGVSQCSDSRLRCGCRPVVAHTTRCAASQGFGLGPQAGDLVIIRVTNTRRSLPNNAEHTVVFSSFSPQRSLRSGRCAAGQHLREQCSTGRLWWSCAVAADFAIPPQPPPQPPPQSSPQPGRRVRPPVCSERDGDAFWRFLAMPFLVMPQIPIRSVGRLP
jgi:hypothetical protein